MLVWAVGQPVQELVGTGPVFPPVNVLLGSEFWGSHTNDSTGEILSEDCKLILYDGAILLEYHLAAIEVW